MQDGLQRTIRHQDIFNFLRCTLSYEYHHNRVNTMNLSTAGPPPVPVHLHSWFMSLWCHIRLINTNSNNLSPLNVIPTVSKIYIIIKCIVVCFKIDIACRTTGSVAIVYEPLHSCQSQSGSCTAVNHCQTAAQLSITIRQLHMLQASSCVPHMMLQS